MAPRALRRALVGASALLCTSALVVLPALGASAIDYDVDDSGGATYTDIQAAVNAATGAGVTPGDRVVVASGNYVAFTVGVDGLEILGAGAATTVVTGTTAINGTTEVSGFTFQGQALPAPPPGPYAPTVLNLGSGAEGSDIHDNVIQNGYQGIYMENVDAVVADPTTIQDNEFLNLHASQGTGVWVSNSEHVVISGNHFENDVADENAVGVNIQCTGAYIAITDNEFINLGNAVAAISSGAGCPSPIREVVIADNNVDGFAGSGAFYFGGNNIVDVSVSNNTAQNTSNPNGALVKFADFWKAAGAGGLQGIGIQGNTFTDAPYGILVQAGVDIASPIGVTNNTFCRISIENVEDPTAGAVSEVGTITNCSLATLSPGGVTGGGAASGQLETLADTGSEGAPLGAVVAALIAAIGVALVVRSRRVTAE